ncbi:hypothetical protein [Burkholderia sp. PU8-34]
MQPHTRKAESNRIEGAAHFDCDCSVPYERLDETSIMAIMVRANLTSWGKAFVRSVRNVGPDHGPCASREHGGGLLASLNENPLFNSRVLEVWNNVSIPDVMHGRTRACHKVHALLIEPDKLVFFEYRRVSDFLARPALYERVGGEWDSATLREAAARLGIGYQLVTDEDPRWVTRLKAHTRPIERNR